MWWTTPKSHLCRPLQSQPRTPPPRALRHQVMLRKSPCPQPKISPQNHSKNAPAGCGSSPSPIESEGTSWQSRVANSSERPPNYVAGEMAEWLKAHAWKACLLERVTWVRIPLSPPYQTKLVTLDSEPTLRDVFPRWLERHAVLQGPVHPLRLKPSDLESVSIGKERILQTQVDASGLCIADKSRTGRRAVAAYGLHVRCSVLRPRGRGRQRALPRQASVVSGLPRHHSNCYSSCLACNGQLHILPGCSSSRASSNRST